MNQQPQLLPADEAVLNDMRLRLIDGTDLAFAKRNGHFVIIDSKREKPQLFGQGMTLTDAYFDYWKKIVKE